MELNLVTVRISSFGDIDSSNTLYFFFYGDLEFDSILLSFLSSFVYFTIPTDLDPRHTSQINFPKTVETSPFVPSGLVLLISFSFNLDKK